MKAFLRQVAAHYWGPDIQDTVFVFPNRRSMVFFRKYLSEEVAAHSPSPILSPRLYTVNDFFYRVYDVDVTDRITLILSLYEVYHSLYPQAEPLDEFVFWGDVILSDFDDVDKYLVDAEGLFRNVAELKDIQDDYSYLTPTQREAIDRFVAHFRDGSGRLTVRPGGEETVKGRFLQIWNLLMPLYKGFRTRLREKGMAYEGMVYRDLAERLQEGMSVQDVLCGAFPEARRYVFVGLNALNACEKRVLSRMRDAGVAEFVWDYVSGMIRDPLNKSSLFMKDNVRSFPQAFPLEAVGVPEVHVISVPSAVGEVKLAPQLLQERVPGEAVETAFVLPDENLLLPLLNSLPPEVDKVNVTMGLPIKSGAVYTLMKAVAALQLRLRPHEGGWLFYHRPVGAILSSTLLSQVLTEGEKAVVARVKREAKYYIPREDLQGGPLLEMIFTPVVTAPGEASAEGNRALSAYLSRIVSYVGWKLREQTSMLLELDYAKRYHMVLNVLSAVDAAVLPQTWLRLLDSLLDTVSVPFRGEPLEGLQIMGPLETRALDFRNLVIFSANEGVFPRRSVSSSFIPPELRKGFGLPTYEFQDAVWAYYFYRMIQRAEKVWLVYDSRTEGMRSGEESRFIKQLEYHFHLPLIRETDAAVVTSVPGENAVGKTEEDIASIRSGLLSATTLQSYLYCPAKFYYQQVKRLKAEDEVAESLDAGMLGNVFHGTMHELYDGKPLLTLSMLEKMLADKAGLHAAVRRHILEEMNSIEVSGRNLVLEGVIYDYVVRTLEQDKRLLEESGSSGFRILGLEKHLYCDFNGFHLHGYVDRIDSFRSGEVRIVDYKTGKVEDDDLNITDENAEAVVAKLFGESNNGRPKIALQLFVYGLLVDEEETLRAPVMVNSIYSTARLFSRPLKDMPRSAEFVSKVTERLKAVLDEMVDPDVPFHRTQDLKTCAMCDFKMICGR